VNFVSSDVGSYVLEMTQKDATNENRLLATYLLFALSPHRLLNEDSMILLVMKQHE